MTKAGKENTMSNVDEGLIEQARALAPRERMLLTALANGAQLVLRDGGVWEAYTEVEGSVRPLCLRTQHERLVALMNFAPQIVFQPNCESQCDFAWLPSAHRDQLRDLLTLSMRTQHLRVIQAEELPSPHREQRRDRQPA
jgi:hypothetical protein